MSIRTSATPTRSMPGSFSRSAPPFEPPLHIQAKERDDMKLIIAIIKPFKLDEVRDALGRVGIEGLTVSEIRGFGRQKGQTEIYRGAEYKTNLVPKTKLELVVGDALAPRVVDQIRESEAQGPTGDGTLMWIAGEQDQRVYKKEN